MKLRGYQTECIQAIRGWYAEGNDTALAVLPTGAGKTIILSSLGMMMRVEGARRIMVLAHRRELVTQAVEKWRKVDPDESLGIYMGSSPTRLPGLGIKMGPRDVTASVIAASVQSCYTDVYDSKPCDACFDPSKVPCGLCGGSGALVGCKRCDGQGVVDPPQRGTGCDACNGEGTVPVFVRPGRIHKGHLKGRRGIDLDLAEIDLIIVDEAHHVAPGSRYTDVIDAVRERNPGAKVLFVTATPFAEDGPRLGAFVDGIAYLIDIKDLVDLGYLVPFSPRSCRIELDIDMSEVRTSKSTGDYVDEDLGKVLDTDSARTEVIKAWRDHAGPGTEHAGPHGRPTVVFCPTVESAEHLSAAFNADGIRSAWICSDKKKCTDEDRRAALEGFDAGDLTVIVNVGILTEGWDSPRVSCVVLYRPTKSRSLYRQMVGRGLRLLGPMIDGAAELRIESSIANGKPDCLVMDCVGASALGLQTLVDLSKPISKEDIFGPDEDDADDEPDPLQMEWPEMAQTEEVEVKGHMAYQIDLFSGQVAWARINGTRIACLTPGRSVVVFGSGGRFSVCAASPKGVDWLERDVGERGEEAAVHEPADVRVLVQDEHAEAPGLAAAFHVDRPEGLERGTDRRHRREAGRRFARFRDTHTRSSLRRPSRPDRS
jgi:superfamily II DNA or RNA helicase